jgi:site-specific recombinase XerD
MTSILREQHTLFLSELKKKGKSNATILAYGKDTEQMVEFLESIAITSWHDVTTKQLESFKQHLEDKRYTAKSIVRKMNAVKAFFRFLHAHNMIELNPSVFVTQPTYEQSLPKILKKMEYRALRDACRKDQRLSSVVEVLLQTGIRISELANLKVSDVVIDKHMIRIQELESRSERIVPLNNAAERSLREYLSIRPKTKEPTLFLTKTCRPFLVRNIRTAIDRYFRIAGIPDAKVNDLRHTFIAEQLMAGVPLIQVSQLVGHKRVTTTEKYLKLLQKDISHSAIKIEEL